MELYYSNLSFVTVNVDVASPEDAFQYTATSGGNVDLAVIIILSLLVMAGLLFAIFGLLFKAEAHSETEGFPEILLLSTDISAHSSFLFIDD